MPIRSDIGERPGPAHDVTAGEHGDALATPPPPQAIPLFAGGELDLWMAQDECAPRWNVRNGYLEVCPGTGNIITKRSFSDFQLHLEFWLPPMPEAPREERANSGVYLQGRYELQLLDTHGEPPACDSCGAVYEQHAPLADATRPAGVWQSLDVAFRAATLDTTGFVSQPARVTAFLNGLLIHDNLPLHGPTAGCLDAYEARRGPIMLQEHGAPVRFRNVWLVEEPRPVY